MVTDSQAQPGQLFLGIEGGGTRTVALLADQNGKAIDRVEAGPANLKLLTDQELARHVRTIAAELPRPDALAIGLAGAWAADDRKRICFAAEKVWRRVPCYATNDLETALSAAGDEEDVELIPKVLILSGTGS